MFAARAAGVSAGARGLEARRNNFTFERVYSCLCKLQVSLSRLLACFQSFIAEPRQQLSFKDLLADVDEEGSDCAFNRRRHTNHVFCADFSRQVDVAGRSRSLRYRRGWFCSLRRDARQYENRGSSKG